MIKIDTSSAWFNNLVAQLGHFGWGALIVLGFAVHGYWYCGVFGVLVWAVPKEFLFDKYVEGQSFKDNLTDFSLYAAGLCAGLVIFFVR